MENEKDKIEWLSDSLLEDRENKKEELENWKNGSPDNKNLYDLFEKVKLAPEVDAFISRQKHPTLYRINSRIDNSVQKRMWLRYAIGAASIILVLVLSNLYSFQTGYKLLNSQDICMENPLGIRSSLQLPDGSKVILNAGTELSYPSAFVTKERNVKLNGEAFFEIVPDKKKPFILNTGDLYVRVYGTQFNVKAYEEDERIEITLNEGSIGVGLKEDTEWIRMEPGEQIRFDKDSRQFIKLPVKTHHYTSWKEGKYYFDRTLLSDIAQQWERAFNVDIQIDSEDLKNTAFTGDFVRGENLEQMLRVMAMDGRISYHMEGDKIVIMEK